MHSPLQRPGWTGRRGLCVVAVALLAACSSCQKDAGDLRAASQTPNVTAAGPVPPADPVTVADGPPDDVNPGETGPSEMDLGDEESVEANPLGGCAACHVDVEDEMKGTIHLAEEIGCIECHGPSDGHVRDENNEVKPDEVFARKDVDRLCGECHQCSRPRGGEPAAEPPADRKVCTDCHQPHSLAPAG